MWRQVTGKVRRTNDEPWVNSQVMFERVVGSFTSEAQYPADALTFTTDYLGELVDCRLWVNESGDRISNYRCSIGAESFTFSIPAGNGSPIALSVLRAGSLPVENYPQSIINYIDTQISEIESTDETYVNLKAAETLSLANNYTNSKITQTLNTALFDGLIRINNQAVTGTSFVATTPITTALNTAGRGGVSMPLQVAATQNSVGIVTGVTLGVFAAATEKPILDIANNKVYAKLTETAGTYTLSFFSNMSGTETAYSFPSATNIDFVIAYRFDFARLPSNFAIASELNNTNTNIGIPQSVIGSLDFDCFLIIGQSNAEGNGKPPDLSFDFPDPRILNYAPGTEPYSNKLILAEYNLLNIQGQSSNGQQIGFGVQFAKQYLAENPTKRVCLLSCALGNTGFSSNHWKVGDPLFATAVAHVNSFLQLYPGSTLKGILWHQGERDHDAHYPILSYQTQLELMIAGLRTQISNSANIPFVCGNYSTNWSSWSSDKADMQDVNFQLTRRVNYTGNVLSTGLDGNFNDVIHFNAPSQRELGNRYYAQWKFATTNIPSAPTSVTNVNVQKYTGTTLIASWVSDNKTDSVTVRARLNNNIVFSRTTKFNNLLLTGLTPSTAYTIEILANNNIGSSSAVSISANTNILSVNIPNDPLIVLDYTNVNNLGQSTGSLGMGTTDNVVSFADPERGNVVKFDNSNPGGILNYNAPAVSFPSTNLTFSTFIKLQQYANDGTIFAVENGDNAGKVILWVDQVAGLELIIAGVSKIKLPTNFIKNTWQHVGFTIGGGLAKLFIDGLKVAEIAATISITSGNNPTWIGELNFNYGCINGMLSDTRVYYQGLTEQQMAKVFELTL